MSGRKNEYNRAYRARKRAERGGSKAAAPKEESKAQETPKVTKAEDVSPITMFKDLGEAKYRETIEQLSVDELKKVIKNNGLDTANRTRSIKDKNKLVDYIVRRTRERASFGDVFRNFVD